MAAIVPVRALLGLELFAEPFFIPETISVAPSNFGPLAGHLFVPDPGPPPHGVDDGRLWTVPPDGGSPNLFATSFDTVADFVDGEFFEVGFRGGTFLPMDFGQFGGTYVLTSFGGISAFDADGTSVVLIDDNDLVKDGRLFARLTSPVVAPDTFGNFSGQLLVSYQLGVNPERDDVWGGVIAVSENGNVTHLVTPSVADEDSPNFANNIEDPFGLAIAPEGFGDIGGKALLGDGRGENIVAIDPRGNYELFTQIANEPGQSFLRHMEFSPSNFGNLGELLFVSVAGDAEGGNRGAVHALNGQGDIFATLTVGDSLDQFDPRGFLFRDDGSVLISDAVHGILSATAADFQIVVPLRAGDADRDFDFDPLDIVRILQSNKYRSGRPATWGEGDWDAAPGGTRDNPPVGNRLFDQRDIVAALQAGVYLTGSYRASVDDDNSPNDNPSDVATAVIYDRATGNLSVAAPAGQDISSLAISSVGGLFRGDRPRGLDGVFDVFTDEGIFKTTIGGSFESIHFGNVLPTELTLQQLQLDLSVSGSLGHGGALDDVQIVYIPEPESIALCFVSALWFLTRRRPSSVTRLSFSRVFPVVKWPITMR